MGGLEQAASVNNSAAPDSGPELRLLGKALVQTKSLSTQLSLTTNQRNPGCLVIRGQHGQQRGLQHELHGLVDSRVKTEIAEADVAELLQLFDSCRPSSTSART